MTITEPDLRLGGSEGKHLGATAHPATIEEIDVIMGAVEANQAETTLPVPTRQDCIDAIVREAKCDRHLAETVNEFWGAVTRASRTKKWGLITRESFDGRAYDGVYHLGDDDLVGFHWVLDIIAPDEQVSPYGEGTAHDLLDRAHCDSTLGERGLVHGKADGVVENCTVTLELRNID